MSKRNAIRITNNPHSSESIAFTINRYGTIKPETLKELTDWLDKHTAEYSYEVITEILKSEEGISMPYQVLKTHRVGSCFEKYIDNQHDAENAISNIRNKDFPKNKQGQ